FGGDDSVWFNLMNEPYDVSATKWAGITQQVVDDLRADGIDNKLLLSGTAWSGAHSWVSSGNAAAYENFHDPLNNFAFDVHQYLDGDSSGTSGSSVSGAGSTRLVKITEWAEANGFKLFLGEAGVADDSQSIKEMGDMLQYMEDHSGAWLGWSLWGAGPWWGNYYFEINPQGGQHDPAIDALMKFMKPGQAAPEPSPEPNPEPQPNPAPSPEPTPTEPSTGIQANNMKGNTAIDGTTGNDTVHTWAGQMDAGDRIQLGEGFDTLVFRNTGLKFDSAVYKGLSGIDHLDMTASTGKAFVVLDEAFLRSTDDGAIKITFGSAGLGGLDASRLADGSYSVEWKSGSVTVVLGDAPAPAPQPSPAPGKSTPDTDLGPAPDPVDVVKPTPTAYEDVAGIRANVYSGARTVDGTDGNDTVYAFNGQIDAGDVIRLGSGHDTFFSLSSRADIDTASMPGYSGVDEFDLSGTARAGYVTLTEGFLANTDHGEVTVNVGDKGLRLLDTSALDHASTDVFLYGDGDVFLSDGDDEVALIRGSQATLHGGGGNDALYGDTADDVLYGDGGMDFLYGDDGNDILVGGAGADLLNGGGGHDVFQYLDIADAGDVLQGFEAGDQLDLLNLLAANGIGSMDEAFSGGYVTAAQAGANATVSFDADGAAGSAKAVTLATIENFASDDLTFAGMSAA
ncbi:MAG: hypothetical protein EOM26_07700, partial [Alphaproteobacteria bacterium]|nr:hypothetical protein [Alphaproteobacteria bacterium]